MSINRGSVSVLLYLLPYLLLAPSHLFALDPPVKVGAVLALTGPAAQAGEYARRGLTLAFEEQNRAGGIEGRPLELVVEDSKTQATGAVSAFNKLVTADRVRAVVGDVWDFLTNPLIPLAQQQKAVLISPKVLAQALTARSDYFFTVGPNMESSQNALRHFFKLNPTLETAGIFCFDNAWGQAWMAAWRAAAAASGVEVIKVICNPMEFDRDYRVDAVQMAQAKPDLIIISYLVERVLKRLEEIKFRRPALTSYDVLIPINEGLLSKEAAEGLYYIDWAPNAEFQKTFRERFGAETLFEAHQAYEAGRSLIRAFLNGGLKGDLLTALRKVRYQGVGGPIDFSSGAAVNHGEALLYVVRNGIPEVVNY